MARVSAPFNVGDNVKFIRHADGNHRKGDIYKVTAIGHGHDQGEIRTGKVAWRVKISGNSDWWSCGWFIKSK